MKSSHHTVKWFKKFNLLWKKFIQLLPKVKHEEILIVHKLKHVVAVAHWHHHRHVHNRLVALEAQHRHSNYDNYYFINNNNDKIIIHSENYPIQYNNSIIIIIIIIAIIVIHWLYSHHLSLSSLSSFQIHSIHQMMIHHRLSRKKNDFQQQQINRMNE